ncbi:AbiH family protein [Streptococcus parauberis]|uniref:AbiH family protein n=1 Tax=Streptococcus parauberis TaxID=1348 RepID=UPI00280ABCB3|nr:AbiH family protein [Streptococcus parauberis]WEM65376.1 AbiH family protein [Streptococcus parauberis]
MKEKNILIIGNGFDLALKRKTKYEDFIKFACQIVGFPDRDKKYISLSETFSFAVSPETILESFNSNKNVLTYEIIEKIINSYSDRYPGLNKNNLNFIYDYNLIFFQDATFIGYDETIEKYVSLFSDNIQFPMGETDYFIEFIHDTFQDLWITYKDSSIYFELLLDIVQTTNFFKDNYSKYTESWYENNKNIKEVNDDKIINSYRAFFDQFSDNIILRFILLNKLKIDNWNNLESQISQLASGITIIKESLKEQDLLFIYNDINSQTDYDKLQSAKNYFQNFQNSSHISFIEELAYQDNSDEISIYSILTRYNHRVEQSLNSLTLLLEFYLFYLDNIEDKKEIIKNNGVNIIDNFGKIDNILTFNYTDTAEQKYNLDKESIHYIHGRQNFIESSIDNNHLVFGIEDNDNIVNNDLVNYQKTFQRIIKKTGFKYKKFIDPSSLKNFDICRIIIFGHSLDILDKEIFLDFFNKDFQKVTKVEFFVLYFGNDDLKSKVRNLSTFLGKDTLVNLSSENYIHFIDTSNFHKAEIEIKEEITRNNRMFQLKVISKRQNYQNYRSIVK